jgi:hypothetical protein
MDRSALSDKELEEGQAASVTISFEDGTSRELAVTPDEAKDLRAKGREVSPWYVHLARKVTRPGIWILGIAVTSLLIPAITKQWADRPKELELRISLIDQIGESAARTVNTARFIVADTLPEAKVREVQCTPEPEDPQAQQGCDEALAEETREEQAAHIDAKSSWLQKGAVIESQLAAYFPGTALAREGKRYIDAVRIYLHLATNVCGDQRDRANNKLLAYLGESRADHEALYAFGEDEELCNTKSEDLDFRGSYGPLGDQLLARRLRLLTLLNESKAQGFSTGLGDFLVDALPALILLAVALAYVLWYAWALRRRLTRRR